MSRNSIIIAVIVVAIIVIMIVLASLKTEVPTHPIETPVELNGTGGNAAAQP
jgi:hypothetical protein